MRVLPFGPLSTAPMSPADELTALKCELHVLRAKLALAQERERELEGLLGMLKPVVAELVLDKALRGHMTPVQAQRLAHVAETLRRQP